MDSIRKRRGRNEEFADSQVATWYLAFCLTIVLIGGAWAVSHFYGSIFGSGSDQPMFDKAAVKATNRIAAERDAQARMAAEQEARNLAEDYKRPTTPEAEAALAEQKASAAAAPESPTPTESAAKN